MKFGYDKDPNEKLVEEYKKLTFDDMMNFYKTNIKNKPIIFAIIGNRSHFDYEKLKDFGNVIETDLFTIN